MSKKNYQVNDHRDLQPHRDKDGNVVMLTPDQCAAVVRAFNIYWQVIEAELRKGTVTNPAFDHKAFLTLTTVTKSCLMGRILYDGKAPLVDAPPTKHAACDYSVEEP